MRSSSRFQARIRFPSSFHLSPAKFPSPCRVVFTKCREKPTKRDGRKIVVPQGLWIRLPWAREQGSLGATAGIAGPQSREEAAVLQGR